MFKSLLPSVEPLCVTGTGKQCKLSRGSVALNPRLPISFPATIFLYMAMVRMLGNAESTKVPLGLVVILVSRTVDKMLRNDSLDFLN